MAGQIKVDSINADSNLALKIANTAVAFIDSSGLRPTSGNVSLDATATSKLYLPSANTVAIQTAGVTAVTVDSSQNVTLAGTLTTTGITNSGVATGARFNPTGSSVTGNGMYLPAVNSLGLSTNGTNAVYIDSSQNVGIGTSSPTQKLQNSSTASAHIYTSTGNTGTGGYGGGYKFLSYDYTNSGSLDAEIAYYYGGASIKAYMSFSTKGNSTQGLTERMRIDSSGNLLVATTSSDVADANGTGASFSVAGNAQFSRASGGVVNINRKTDDGVLVYLQQDATAEGTISVSGTTVSYNGGHLSRWSQLPNNQKDNTLLKGTVMSNLNDMCVWTKDGEILPNEQLNKMKVSDIDGDTNVAGVFVSWEFDEQCQSDDMNVAMTGDMIIRIAQGVTVQRGDLLMSAGDGTAKPQDDDIRRSKTIAKVTSNHVTCTYADGSYCVPCVLMAC
jgi:hypothetical protein